MRAAKTIPKITELEELARLALDGNREALESLIGALQADVFGIALRMLGNQEDAEDATQEILIRIVTRLSQFDFRSKLKTWAYRIAVNYVLDLQRSPAQRQKRSFHELAEAIVAGISQESPSETERSLLVEEVKVACTLGMLQCLDRPLRAAYILGEIMELGGPQAAEILEISPSLFRKRLEKARSEMMMFLRGYCGLVSDAAPCKCNRQVPVALRAGLVHQNGCRFSVTETSFEEIRAKVRRVEEARWAFQVHHTSRMPGSSVDFARRMLAVLDVHFDQSNRS